MARGTIAAGSPRAAGSEITDPRLEDARRAFQEAQSTLEEARAHLLRTHLETSRLWGAA